MSIHEVRKQRFHQAEGKRRKLFLRIRSESNENNTNLSVGNSDFQIKSYMLYSLTFFKGHFENYKYTLLICY